MDNYVISEQEEEIEAPCPFPSSYSTQNVMRIGKNTKFSKILEHVRKLFQDNTRYVIFSGIGDAADKCISCVEVMKNASQEVLYQWNKLTTARRITYWDPVIDGLERLKVSVDTPVMFILISRDPFPAEHQCLSMQTSSISPHIRSNKTPKKITTMEHSDNKWKRPSKDVNNKDSQQRRQIQKEVEKESMSISKE